MKKSTIFLLLFFTTIIVHAQVGINTTIPNAQLDIRSTNQATPSNTDGILIPKVDAFPATNPTAAQQGMLVYLTTTSGTDLPGFYYWDDATVDWKPITGTSVGTLDQAYDFGGAGNGRIITADAGAVLINGTDGLVSTGITGSGAVAPSGSGTKMFWNPRKAAFRAGQVYTPKWDDVNIGNNSIAFGLETRASGDISTAFGTFTSAIGEYSTAFGFGASANGERSIAFGSNTFSSGYGSTAFGSTTTSSGVFSTSFGSVTTASGGSSTSFGSTTTASGENATSFGASTAASGENATSFGANTAASGENATSFGGFTFANGNMATAFGSSTIASGNSSTAFGEGTNAIGDRSMAFGYANFANGSLSTVSGIQNTASSYAETVIGIGATSYIPSLNGATQFRSANAADRLFVIGNAIDNNNNNIVDLSEQSDAIIVLKNGLTRLPSTTNAMITAADGKAIVTKEFLQNNTSGTLDQAYDFGGAGNGKTITADAGAVTIGGTDGLVATGIYGSGELAPTGIGTRMFWNPRKGAFRAGNVTGGEWDDSNLGSFSAAFGTNNTASGYNSVAFGFGNSASGILSIAFGNSNFSSGHYTTSFGEINIASGMSSTVFGFNNEAFGAISTAFGQSTVAIGTNSTSFGRNNQAVSFGETVLGIGATTYTATTNGVTQFGVTNATDRLFVIGNAIDSNNSGLVDVSERSDALIILKNGLTRLPSTTNAMITAADGKALVTKEYLQSNTSGTLDQAYDFGGAGNGRIITADSGAMTINGTDGLVSTGTFNTGVVAPAGGGTKLVWNPRKAAIRAGNVFGAEWDNANIGSFSAAFGENTTASGPYSFSMGYANTASGQSSVALGQSNSALGNNSVALGYQTSSNNLYATAFGFGSQANNESATAFGRSTVASGLASTSFGWTNTASGTVSTAFGLGNNASSDYSTAFGRQNSALSYGETVLGIGATTYTPSTNGSTQFRTANATDRLFVIGNAIDTNNNNLVDVAEQSNAMVVLKNGNTGFGTSTPAVNFEIRKPDPILRISADDTNSSFLQLYEMTAGLPYGYMFEYDGNLDKLHLWSKGFTGNDGIRMTWLKDGNVGIGTTTPLTRLDVVDVNTITSNLVYGNLHVRSNNAQNIDIGGAITLGGYNDDTMVQPRVFGSVEGRKSNATTNSSSGYLIFKTNNAGTLAERLRITNTGSVGVGIPNPLGLFELALDQGRKPGTNTWTIVSDQRLKTINGSYIKGLNEIIQLNPIRFNYKNVGERTFDKKVLETEFAGFIAQEVQPLFPDAVGTDDDGFLNFNIHPILIASINAIKELNANNQSLKDENEQLKQQLEILLLQQKNQESINKTIAERLAALESKN